MNYPLGQDDFVYKFQIVGYRKSSKFEEREIEKLYNQILQTYEIENQFKLVINRLQLEAERLERSTKNSNKLIE